MNKLPRLFISLCMMLCIHTFGQSTAVQSSLINLGTNTCGDNTNVTFSSVGNPNTSPYLITNCLLTSIFTDVFSKFIAYNPKDNKIYINDISHNDSRVYIYDMGLPNNYTCPLTMPLTPTYQYSYVPNNWEFDINGNVWCIRGLSGNYGIIERIDETTGTIISTRTIDFPANNVPNTLGSGDIVILPNGRLFIAVGDSPTKFFEVTNYSGGSGDAIANYIQDMPKPCYGILYLNGTIELTGTDLSSNCYKYLYDIPSKVMGAEQPFQLGMSPIDNASISPATGISKQLISSIIVNPTTSDIKYEMSARNMGNVKLNNFNVTDDLGAVFGTANVSNVSVTLDAGANPDSLVLNPLYDGVSNTKIFKRSQVLSNLGNGYVNFTVSLRATNLIANKIYYNTAKSNGDIGTGSSKISVVDSSNNGSSAAIDPNNDGDAGDKGENVPTPYFFGFVLPIQFINVVALHAGDNLNTISWTIGETQIPVAKFQVEYSEDGISWNVVGTVDRALNKTNYFINHTTSSGSTMYYRVWAYDNKGEHYLSKEVVVRTKDKGKITILPVPADDFITVTSSGGNFSANRIINIIDATGKIVYTHSFLSNYIRIPTASYPQGYYIVNVIDKGDMTSSGIMIMHH